ALETFADPAHTVDLPANIFPGADERVWFTSLGSDRLGAIDPMAADPAATITTYAHPDLAAPSRWSRLPTGACGSVCAAAVRSAASTPGTRSPCAPSASIGPTRSRHPRPCSSTARSACG